jgi:predicted metal-binding membrane protein
VALIAVYVLLEKTLPLGPWIGRLTGLSLIVWSLLLLGQVP